MDTRLERTFDGMELFVCMRIGIGTGNGKLRLTIVLKKVCALCSVQSTRQYLL